MPASPVEVSGLDTQLQLQLLILTSYQGSGGSGGSRGGSTDWVSCPSHKRIPGSWLWPKPSPDCCEYLSSEPVNGSCLSLSLSVSETNKFKVNKVKF